MAHVKNSKWTNEMMLSFIGMWIDGRSLEEIAEHFSVSRHAVNKMAGRMRRDGIKLKRRNAGHVTQRSNSLWTQSEIEYLIRRRSEGVSSEQIGEELGRSFLAVQGMIARLSKEGASIKKLGSGQKRLWSIEAVNMAVARSDI